jgi:hypothetical protein
MSLPALESKCVGIDYGFGIMPLQRKGDSMLSQHKKFHDDAIHILSKLPHLGAEEILTPLKNNTLTLHDLFTHILTDEKIDECIRITQEAFHKNETAMTFLYETEICLKELATLKKLFLSIPIEEKSKSDISIDTIDLRKLLAPPSRAQLSSQNVYYNVYYDTLAVLHTKYYEPTFTNFKETALVMIDDIFRMTKNHPVHLYFYLLANIHQYLNTQFCPKNKNYLRSILTEFRSNRFNATAEMYIVKALLQMIIRETDPKKLIAKNDFEDAQIFRQKLIPYMNLSDEKNIQNKNQIKSLNYIQKKESKYTQLLMDTKIDENQIFKLIFKLGALHYAKEQILKGELAETIFPSIKAVFGKDIFKHRFKSTSRLQIKIEKVNRAFPHFFSPSPKNTELNDLPKEALKK